MFRVNNEDFEPGLETHFENLLKYSPDLWRTYKKKILDFITKRDQLEGFDILAGQGFYRIKFRDGITKLLYLFSAGDISLVKEVRFLKGVTGVLQRKEVVYIPAYSFTVDVPITLVYWGKKMPLDPHFWQRREVTSLLIEVPSLHMKYSLANMVWPRTVERYFLMESLGPTYKLAQSYLFNSLPPPYFDDSGAFHPLEAPTFVLTGDDSVKLVSIHKVVFNVLPVQNRGDLWKASILTSDFKIKTIDCKLFFKEALVEPRSLREGLLVASLVVGKNGTTKPFYYIYPIKHVASGEGYGVVLTLLSILLRKLYIHSDHPLIIDVNLKELFTRISSILSAFKGGDSELAAHIMRDERGIEILIQALEVYHIESGRIVYLHPYLMEMIANFYGGIDKVPPAITPSKIVIKVLECLDTLEKNDIGIYFKRGIVKWMRENLSVNRPEIVMDKFITSSACLARASCLTKLAYGGVFA
ncbi:MAG: hypothetical protein QXY58_05080 [Nitrososphaerota archaeon]